MDNNYGMPPYNSSNNTNFNNSNNTNFVLAVVSATLGIMSLLFTVCVPWLTCLIAAGGVTCGIISWVNTKREGGQLALPIVGTIISGVSLIVATIIVIAFHIAISKLEQNYDEIDQQMRNMRDSLQQWDTLYFPGELSEPDSTFFIDN
jgi:hypothetical protein